MTDLNPAQKMDYLVTSIETMMQGSGEKSDLTLTDIKDAVTGAVTEAVTEALIKDRAALAQEHKHGMSDPECPGCSAVVEESLDGARKEIVTYYAGIPGVTKLTEIWEEQQAYRRELKARGEDPNQELVTII